MNKTLQEINKKHPKRGGLYYLNDKEYPAVTEILQVLAKPQLISWAVKETAKIALADPSLSIGEITSKFYSIRSQAAERGKAVHSLFEAYSLGNIPDISKLPDNIKPYAQGIDTFFKEYAPQRLFSEKIVFSDKYNFAGTLDNVIKTRNYIWCLDLKTSKNIYPEYSLQLECYRLALEEMKLCEKIDKTIILQVPGDGTFSLTEIKGDIKVFMALKEIWEWQR